VSEKREDIQLDLQEDDRQREDRKGKSRILRRVVENQGLDLVEGSTPSKTEKETAGRAGAGKVEAPAPNDRMRERRPYQGAAQDERPQGGSGGSICHRERKKIPSHKKMSRAEPSEEKEL
jgi:hypothetical protein